ncbi:MAG: RidA family protein [Rhodospirillaceae bacterium]|nr:RidA family protein [Rhodospirillaceae bacterium]
MRKRIYGLLAAVLLCGCTPASDIQRIQPADVYDTTKRGFSQVVVTPATAKIVTVSGTVAFSPDGSVVGEGNLEAQLSAALDNVAKSLTAAKSSPGDIVQMRVYVVNLKPEDRAVIVRGLDAFYGDAPRGASTVIGIQGLMRSDLLVEVEAVGLAR